LLAEPYRAEEKRMTENAQSRPGGASVEIAGAHPLEDVRKGADKFYRRILWRNAIEYVACVIVLIGFGTYLLTLEHHFQKAGSVLVIAATLFVAWQLHRRASAEPPERAGTAPLLLFARTPLVRQRDALRSIFWRHILPFLPGMAVLMTGAMLSQRPTGPEPHDTVGFAALIALLVGIWWINPLAARNLQKHIADALTRGAE
jgi:hypothetical protein